MTFLQLIREEYEPIRESYYRTWIFRIENSVLNYSLVAAGRISEDIKLEILLSDGQMQQLLSLVDNSKLSQNFVDSINEIPDQLQITYQSNLRLNGEKFNQKLSGPNKILYTQFGYMDKIWRLLAGFVQDHKKEKH